jgi:hypothetical protein
MKIRFTRDFAGNWREGDEVEATFKTRGNDTGYLIDNVALIDARDFLDAVKVGTIQIIEEDAEESGEKHRLNPCKDLCYIRYGKQYSEKCDEECEFAYAVKQLKKQKEQICSLCKALYTNQDKQPLCDNCTNKE